MEQRSKREPAHKRTSISGLWSCGCAKGNHRDQECSRPKNVHIDQPKFTPDKTDGLFCGALCSLPRVQDLTPFEFMQRRSVSTVWSCDEGTRAEEMHNI